MDFEFYRNFITVAEAGNLTAAARKLAVAQPALSAQLKILEEHYGTPLIKTKRGQRQLQLTEAGEAFGKCPQALCYGGKPAATATGIGGAGQRNFTH